jgi:hypothetical protein
MKNCFLFRKVLVVAVIGFGVSIFGGCSTHRVVVQTNHYAENAPQSLVTYNWFKSAEGDDILGNNQFIYHSIQKAIDRELDKKGYKTPATAPDVQIGMLIVTSRDGLDVTMDRYFGDDLRGERSEAASDALAKLPRQSLEEGTIVLDAVNARTHKLVWRGTGQTNVNRENSPEERAEKIAFIVNSLLERFPESKPSTAPIP